MLVTNNVVTKEEVTAAIKELAEKMGRRPNMLEICRTLNIGARRIRKLFGTYGRAVKACGLTPLNSGALTMTELFEDWMGVAKKVNRVPTINDYEAESRFSPRPLKDRVGPWKTLPAYMLKFGDDKALWAGREDIRNLLVKHAEEWQTTSTGVRAKTSTGELMDVNLLYGKPLNLDPMATAPVNEMGVVYLFGTLARELGFVVMKMQPGFPDCEALRRLDNGKWQRVRIEFEFESRNFVWHAHDVTGCELIVCWENNWEDCPIEVLELRTIFTADSRG